jgi:hypothetical protein
VQVRRFRGIAEYFEDFVEQYHQRVKGFSATGKIRNLEERANYQCWKEEVTNSTEVQKSGAARGKKAKRRFKSRRDKKLVSEEQREMRKQSRLDA